MARWHVEDSWRPKAKGGRYRDFEMLYQNCFKHVSVEFDRFGLDTHLCKLRGTPAAHVTDVLLLFEIHIYIIYIYIYV